VNIIVVQNTGFCLLLPTGATVLYVNRVFVIVELLLPVLILLMTAGSHSRIFAVRI
jgi:hypothetical protein